METLEKFWIDKKLAKKIKELRDKLPPFFSRFSDADLLLTWRKFQGDHLDYEGGARINKTNVNNFVATLDITAKDLEEDYDDEEYDEEEVDDDYLDRDGDLDFERNRPPREDDFDDRDF